MFEVTSVPFLFMDKYHIDEVLKLAPEYDPEDSQWVKDYEEVIKPFPNEHAFRLKSPGGYKRFRRQNDKFGTGIHAIWGIRKDDEKVELQSIRFSSKKWAYSDAKKWVKDHDYKPILSEPASGKEMDALKISMSDWLEKVKDLGEEYKRQYDSTIIKADDEGPVRFRLTELKVDRIGDVVKPNGVNLKNYKTNPIVMYGHGRLGSYVPIGKIDPKSFDQTPEHLDADVYFDDDGTDPFSTMIANKVRKGFLNTGSIGFRVIDESSEPILPKQTGPTFTKTELLEYSIVPIPALTSALAQREWDEFKMVCKDFGHPINEEWLKEFGDFEYKECDLICFTEKAMKDLKELMDEYELCPEVLMKEIKEGRVLSGKNRRLVKDAYGILIVAAEALDSLLKATEQPSKEDGKAVDNIIEYLQGNFNMLKLQNELDEIKKYIT